MLVGVLLSGLFFAQKVGRVLRVEREPGDDPSVQAWRVVGQVFLVSSDAFARGFDTGEKPSVVRIDVSHAHFWDTTAVQALDRVVLKLRRAGAQVEVVGMNEATSTTVDRFARHDKPHAPQGLAGH